MSYPQGNPAEEPVRPGELSAEGQDEAAEDERRARIANPCGDGKAARRIADLLERAKA